LSFKGAPAKGQLITLVLLIVVAIAAAYFVFVSRG
jgi:hypothetical protein